MESKLFNNFYFTESIFFLTQQSDHCFQFFIHGVIMSLICLIPDEIQLNCLFYLKHHFPIFCIGLFLFGEIKRKRKRRKKKVQRSDCHSFFTNVRPRKFAASMPSSWSIICSFSRSGNPNTSKASHYSFKLKAPKFAFLNFEIICCLAQNASFSKKATWTPMGWNHNHSAYERTVCYGYEQLPLESSSLN